MRRLMVCLTALILGTALVWCLQAKGAGAEGAGEEGVRRSILQGSWYPAETGDLRRLIRNRLSEATPPEIQGRVRALVVPHAGYTYSGGVAAHAYRLIQGSAFDRVILIGPSHRRAFEGVSVARHDAYETPLGRVPVDRAAADRLIASSPAIRFVPEAHAVEHSLEIQLPFLQVVLGDFRIVPVLMGRQGLDTCSVLAEALSGALGDGGKTLIVASTDLSHYHDRETARALDSVFIRHLTAFDPEGLLRALAAGRCEACGGGPAAAALMAARRLGAKRCVMLDRADSGDRTGDRERVVGYVSAAVVE
jgi:MEMO1 family protein